jgi:hypothetical protein
MKKITALVFGLSLSVAGLSLAAQAPQTPAKEGANNTPAPVAKKRVKKVKKNKNASEPAATSAAPGTGAAASTPAAPKK